MNKDDWWKYPNSFLKLIMNSGETKEVDQEDINSEIFEALVALWDRMGDYVSLPFPGDYGIDTTFDAGTASFTITKGELPLSHGYFASQYDDWESAWGCVESHYLRLTDKSTIEWSLPTKPASNPFLAVIRYEGDLWCDCDVCEESRQRGLDASLKHSRAWLGELESAMGFLLLKEGFPKELYEKEW